MSISSPEGQAGRPPPGPTKASMNIIRFAMLAGTVFFGGLAWYLVQSGQIEPAIEASLASTIRLVFYVALVGVMLGLAFLRQRLTQAQVWARRASLLLLGYALAEGLTFFGIVYLFLTGDPALFLGGLLVFLLTFPFLPVRLPADDP